VYSLETDLDAVLEIQALPGEALAAFFAFLRASSGRTTRVIEPTRRTFEIRPITTSVIGHAGAPTVEEAEA